MTLDVRRLGRRALLAALASVAATPALAELDTSEILPPSPRAPGPAYASWFRIAPETARNWIVSEVVQDPLQVHARPRKLGAAKAQFRIVVLYPRQSSAYDVAFSKILDVFTTKGIAADLIVINYNKEELRGQYAVGVAETGGSDLLISMGSESTAWLWANYRGGRVPVVSVCAKDPVVLSQMASYDVGSGINFAFTSLNVPVDVQMEYVARLRPSLRNLAILVDANNVSAVETQAKPIERYAQARGVRVFNIGVQNPATARLELEEQVRDAVVRMRKNDPGLDHSLFYITGSTTVFREIATINAQAERVPVLSAVPEVVTAGDDSATLSIGVSFESNAYLAAIYVVDVIMHRVTVGDLKVGVVSPPDIAISFRKTREIGLHIPFDILESANNVYDYDGRLVRTDVVVAIAQ